MYKPRNLKGGLFRVAVGLLFLYFAWDHWNQIAALEAGQDIRVKMWRPLAMIYNQGGGWSVFAKWLGQIGSIVLSLGLLAWGISDLRSEPEPEKPPQPARRLP